MCKEGAVWHSSVLGHFFLALEQLIQTKTLRKSHPGSNGGAVVAGAGFCGSSRKYQASLGSILETRKAPPRAAGKLNAVHAVGENQALWVPVSVLPRTPIEVVSQCRVLLCS